jgi:hypothetical protein
VYLIVLLALTGGLTYLMWQLAHTTPRVLVMMFPPRLFYIFGVFLLLFGAFMAFGNAYKLHSGEGVLEALITIYAGVWWILASTAGMRGSYEDERMMRRLFAMLGVMVAAILATVFLPDPRHVAVISLGMITAGFFVASNYLRDLDRGR